MSRDYSVEAYLKAREGRLNRWVRCFRTKSAIKSITDGGGLIAEIGASTCESAAMISAAKPASLVLALDKSLKQLCLDCSGTCKTCADARSLPLPAESCSAVVLISTFKHIYYPEKLLQELQRVLVRTGELVIVEPAWWLLKLAGKIGYFDLANIANLWKPADYRATLSKNQFDVRRSGYIGMMTYQIVVARKS